MPEKSIILVFLLLSSFAARAEWTGPPESVIYVIGSGVAILIFFASSLLFWGLNYGMSQIVKKRIGFPWLQSMISLIFLIILVTADETWKYIGQLAYELQKPMYHALISSCLSLGWLIGFILSPGKRK